MNTKTEQLRIIPVGGVEEIGINMTIYEYGEDILIVDAGLGFPGPTMKSVRYAIPNYTWLEKNKHRIRGLVVTHAHLDHIGAIPYILPALGNPPIYSLPLSIGYIQQRLQEFNLHETARLCRVSPDDVLQLGAFTVEFYRVNHNIPDSMGLSISTPVGRVIHTGDWKFDSTPVDEKPAEVNKLATWGGTGVLALLSDSTNANKPGYCISEQNLSSTIDTIFRETTGRLLFTCNSFLISRIQQVFDSAAKYNRRVLVVGRSISQNIETAVRLGYLQVQPDRILDGRKRHSLPDHRIVILTTGAQGEELAGLPRMARGEHRQVQIKAGDTAVVSANPIPGNEPALTGLVAALQRQGVDVVYNQLLDIHTSGHAHQDELKLMLGLVKPAYLIPIHGERHMLTSHSKLGQSMGMTQDHTLMPCNGDAVVFSKDTPAYIDAGAVEAQRMYVDDIGHAVLEPEVLGDQQQLRTEGMVTIIISFDSGLGRLVTEPTIVSRGFMYIKGNEHIIRELQHEVRKVCETNASKRVSLSELKTTVSLRVSEYLFRKTNRSPLVVPVITEA